MFPLGTGLFTWKLNQVTQGLSTSTTSLVVSFFLLEMRYNHFTYVDNEIAYFDILDTSYEVSSHPTIVHTRTVTRL